MFDEFGYPMCPVGAFEPRAGGSMRLHGGKGGSSMPAPDPRLVQAQIQSLGTQDDMIRRIVEQSEEIAPLQREQLQFGLSSARTAFDQAQEDRAYMLGRRGLLTQQQDRMVQDAAEFNSDARREELRNEAYADVGAAFDSTNDQAMRGLQRRGVNPNSGRASAMATAGSIAKAAALASAGQKVSQAARAEGYALTDRASNALAGYPALGMQATQAGAGYGTAGLGLANQGQQGLTAGYGTASGIAAQQGNNAANMYGIQSNAYVNSQNQGESMGGLLGGLGGALTGLKAVGLLSDPRLKDRVELVGRDERTGLNLYEFCYVGGTKRYRGVMADEVLVSYPEAVLEDPLGYLMVDYTRLGLEMEEVV